MKMKCIIVDDEPPAIRVLKAFVEQTPGVELITTCKDAFEAIEAIDKHEPDLVFLDVEMPKLNGISLVKTLKNPPLIVLVTAYTDYAVTGYELDILDYLVKPVPYDRFVKTIQKAKDQFSTNQQKESTLNIRADKKIYRLPTDSIYYIQAYGDYVKIFTTEKTIVTKERLSGIKKSLPNEFLQVHRSYIIALNRIEYIEGNQLFMNGQYIPISASYKAELLDRMG